MSAESGRSYRAMSPSISQASTSIAEFHKVLLSSTRILALCGAGLSASSGLGTFRGAGGMWRNYEATALATPEAFEEDPGLVWLFYSYRRHKALQAKPNSGHYALTELSKKIPGFITITQNVDGLSQRSNHPREQLKLVHGSLFDIKCFDCEHIIHNNYDDPYHPSLAITSPTDTRLAPSFITTNRAPDISDPNHPITRIPESTLPHCPECKTGLQRPGVVWFGEPLLEDTMTEINMWLYGGKVDLMLVIGTTATVHPAAGYVQRAREMGARVVVVNFDDGELGTASQLGKDDFLFLGDAAVILPELFKPVIGDLARNDEESANPGS